VYGIRWLTVVGTIHSYVWFALQVRQWWVPYLFGWSSHTRRCLLKSVDADQCAINPSVIFVSSHSIDEEHRNMPVKLNRSGYNHAVKLIEEGHAVLDKRDDWSEHQPSTQEETRFIQEYGFREYRKWHLGIDDALGESNKRHYKFPYSDFKNVHRCAVLAAESRAGQNKYIDIEIAAAHLHGMLEALENVARPSS
jgi:hypothetical protein